MMDVLRQFQLLRPEWLLALIPLLLLCGWLMRRGGGADSAWRRAVDPALLSHLMSSEASRPGRLPLLLAAGWLIAVLALAGPVWEKLPQPVLQQRDAVVVVLDLSLSMYATDLTPTRLQRARFKLHDLLERRQEGLTALVVYSADAHIVAPLTDDNATIANLLPALSPDLMPVYGSNPVAGVATAIDLLENAEVTQGRILLVTDDLTPDDLDALPPLLGDRWQLSVLGVGTPEGAPVRLGDGLLRDSSGEIVIPRLPRGRLQALASASGGHYSDLRVDEADLDQLVPPPGPDAELTAVERQFDQWRERGHWLVVLLLPLAALGARRGWLLTLLLAATLTPLAVPVAHAQSVPAATAAEEPEPAWRATLRQQWRNLWQRPDQQGAAALRQGRPDEAAERFADPAWRGSARYQAGDYEAAAEDFAELDSADGFYNRGNALAQAGQFRQALVAYDAALERDPNHADAASNRRIVQEALRQQTAPEQSQRSDTPQSQQGQPEENGDQSDEGGDQSAGSPDDQSSSSQPEGERSDTAPNSQPPADASDNAGGQTDSEPSDQTRSAGDAGHDNGSTAEERPGEASDPTAGDAGADEPRRPLPGGERSDQDQAQQSTQNTAVAGASAEDEGNADDAAVERWLRRIPDDPGGLLRRKFEYESRQRAGERPRRDTDQPLW